MSASRSRPYGSGKRGYGATFGYRPPMKRQRAAGFTGWSPFATPGRLAAARRAAARTELKFHDLDIDDAVVASAGAIQTSGTVNAIAQGVTESNRIGRKCTIRSINWRWTVFLPETDAVATPAAPDTLRIILYLDKQCNGAAAAVTDLLETADHHSFNNLANKGRFKVLMDRRVDINYAGLASDNAGVVSQAAVTCDGMFYQKCNIPIEFDSTTGAITEVRSNNIGVLLISGNGTCGFGSKMRLRFEG